MLILAGCAVKRMFHGTLHFFFLKNKSAGISFPALFPQKF